MSAILLMAFYSFVSTQTMSAFEESSEISVQTDIRQTMSALVQELEGARLSCLDSNANWVCYQMPRTGTSGAMILDANGAVQYGANAFDNSGWQANGYYQIVFVDDANTAPVVESALANSSNPSGQNISGSYAFGSTNFTANYAKAYYYGHFQVQCHSVPPNSIISATGPSGPLVGPVRDLPGKCLRMYDKTDVNSTKRTWPWSGGFFYMRNLQATPTLNAAGTGLGTVWSPQTAETFTDTNANGVYAAGEAFTDVNGNGQYKGADCEPFLDTNGNYVKDGFESFTATNGNGVGDGSLRIQIRSFDAQRTMNQTGNQRDTKAAIRLMSTLVKIRNN